MGVISKHTTRVKPPRLAEWIVGQCSQYEFRFSMQGDLREAFDGRASNLGKLSAIIWYWLQTCNMLVTYIKYRSRSKYDMSRDNLKIAWRNITKQKAYAFINMAGMTIGLACCLYILLYVRFELSFDRFHDKADRIFRLVDSFESTTGKSDLATSSAPFAPNLKREFPEVEEAARIMMSWRHFIERDNQKFYEDHIVWADASLFRIFSFAMIEGESQTALREPNTVVVNETTAMKYFGTLDVLNQTLIIDGESYIITGIMEDIPSNSHIFASMFMSMSTLEQIQIYQEAYFTSWARHEFYTYLLLRSADDADALKPKLPDFIERHAAEQIWTILGERIQSDIQPLKRIHLYSHREQEFKTNGDIVTVYLFACVALFVLLIACFNTMNLSTALYSTRIKEVRLRKVVGAGRGQLLSQFIGESFFITGFSGVLALGLVGGLLPYFGKMVGTAIPTRSVFDPLFLGALFLIIILTALISSGYPALLLSGYRPADMFQNRSDHLARGMGLRKALVILQFAISIALIGVSFVVADQIDFVKNRKLGFKKDHVITVPIRSGHIRNNYEQVKADLLQNPGITHATVSIGVPGGVVAGDAIDFVTEEGTKRHTVRMFYADHDFIKTLGANIVSGRDFSKTMSTDAGKAILVNEALVRDLGLKEPLGTEFVWGAGSSWEKRGRIIGVMQDFQYMSLKSEISPLVIQIQPSSSRLFALRIRPDDVSGTIRFIEHSFRDLDPEHPFEYRFMDEQIDQLYRSEEEMGRVMQHFTLLAIFIAVLGLFGLASFTIRQRTKEIGIRKVLGASVFGLVIYFLKLFGRWVILANIVAWPALYLFMRSWLAGYAYHVSLGPMVFLISSGIALVIAIVTVSVQSVRSARANPVDALRYE